MQLFNEIIRTDSSPKRNAETEFEFLERSARPEIGNARRQLQQMFDTYSAEESYDLSRRLKSGDDQLFRSAFFELALYFILRKQGFQLSPHPQLSNGSSKRPDFLVTSPNGAQFYLEAVLASEDKSGLNGRCRMVASTLDLFANCRHDYFRVDISHSGLPKTQPSTRALKAKVFQWLDSLDADEIWRTYPSSGGLFPKPFVYQHEEWRLELRARAIPPERRGKSTSLRGVSSRGFGFIDSASPLRDAILSKGNRYGELDKPFLIAINFDTPFLDKEDEISALYGSAQMAIEELPGSDSQQVTVARLPDGAWNGPKGPQYKRVSGTWIFNDLDIYALCTRRSTLYMNPWAKRALPEELRQFSYAELKDTGFIVHEGVSFRSIFDLPLGWPEI